MAGSGWVFFVLFPFFFLVMVCEDGGGEGGRVVALSHKGGETWE